MSQLATKQSLLDAADYRYNFDREIYFNRSTKKIFSVDFIEDHAPAEIEERIREDTDGRDWKFYCNVEPSDHVKREIARVLG